MRLNIECQEAIVSMYILDIKISYIKYSDVDEISLHYTFGQKGLEVDDKFLKSHRGGQNPVIQACNNLSRQHGVLRGAFPCPGSEILRI